VELRLLTTSGVPSRVSSLMNSSPRPHRAAARCPKAPERKIPRSISEGARDAARALADTEAHLKRILRLGRLRLRGPRGAQDEFTLAAIAQNLRRLAKLVARPPPTSAAACAV
jgi:hypothetical protein